MLFFLLKNEAKKGAYGDFHHTGVQMKEQLQLLLNEVKEQLQALTEGNSESMERLLQLRVHYLGKKRHIQSIMKNMRDMTVEERKALGQEINVIKDTMTELIERKLTELEEKRIQAEIEQQKIDITKPAKQVTTKGNFHILNKMRREVEDFFLSMGYEVVDGGEVEKDYYNFEAVNIPKDHPARDMQDTFFIDAEHLLRTHTSGMQARTLEVKQESDYPIKIIAPGKVYRRDDDDATHSHQFMQIELMYVGENISLADLKGTLQELADHLFGKGRKIRMRPSYFPFTEPSVELDVTCSKCEGAGCSICKGTGYIEILGAGSIHPHVLELAGIDSTKYSGFAAGIGVERIAMLKYGIEDIRNFYTNDVRFLKQFK